MKRSPNRGISGRLRTGDLAPMPGAFLRDLSPCRGPDRVTGRAASLTPVCHPHAGWRRGPDYPGDPGAGAIIGGVDASIDTGIALDCAGFQYPGPLCRTAGCGLRSGRARVQAAAQPVVTFGCDRGMAGTVSCAAGSQEGFPALTGLGGRASADSVHRRWHCLSC